MSEVAVGGVRARAERLRGVLLLVTAILGATVLVGLVVTLGEANRQRDKATALQSHSYEVMILARTLSGTMARAEASLGRYVISGDRALGQQYSDEWKLAGAQLDRLDAVTDDPEENVKIDALRKAYATRGDELALTALSTNYKKNAQALGTFYKSRRTESLQQIDDLLETFGARERTLLQSRTSNAMSTVDQANRSASILAMFGVLIALAAIALGWATVQALGERAAARAEADAERERSEALEVAVAQATADLQAEVHERIEAEARLRQAHKMDAVGQLTGGIAHDFNNMLAVVLGGLELARRHLDDGAARRHIDRAAEGAQRAAALTKRLLAFARAEPLLPESINPARLIAEMSDLLARTLGGAVAVDVRDEGDGWMVWADRHQLENALLNLAVNGRDAMDGRGTLTLVTGTRELSQGEVGSCAAGDYVTIAVGDTGHGIPPEVLERVFEPFFTTKPAGKGTGLGLSQIFAFVRQSTGEIAIVSPPGEGTTAMLYLPRHIAAPVALKTAQPKAKPARKAARRGLDILVVEDDPRVLAATVEALTELGHRPVACGDPLAAPAALAAMARIDLIVSDVQMPGQTGPEMAAVLAPDWPDVGVLFVTGYAGELESEGFCGHQVLRKPFTLAALERAVAEAGAPRPLAAVVAAA